jgi:hypothetical protein
MEFCFTKKSCTDKLYPSTTAFCQVAVEKKQIRNTLLLESPTSEKLTIPPSNNYAKYQATVEISYQFRSVVFQSVLQQCRYCPTL